MRQRRRVTTQHTINLRTHQACRRQRFARRMRHQIKGIAPLKATEGGIPDTFYVRLFQDLAPFYNLLRCQNLMHQSADSALTRSHISIGINRRT